MPDERLTDAARQQQFLNVISRDEAEQRFHAHLSLTPLGTETTPLSAARGRVLADDVASTIDVPAFDRANVDGFALLAADVAGALDEHPRRLRLNAEVLSPGVVPNIAVSPGTATPIATGGMLPRGADAVVMIEQTDFVAGAPVPSIDVRRAVAPGDFIAFAGSDIALGETALWAGQSLTSREVGVLAAIGRANVSVYRRARVAILSTGNEIIAPGEPPRPGTVYDSNAAILSAAVEELGGEPVSLGVIPDDEPALRIALSRALDCDVVLLSGGTSKGAGDLSYRVISELSDPGIVAHGVALKPGKPICLAVTRGKPVVVLPGFPTSAIFTFHEFVAPVIRALGGRPREERATLTAVTPYRIHSDRGRTEYLLTRLARSEAGIVAYPLGKGSGSVTTFSLADGFVTIDTQTEMLEAGTAVDVTLLDRELLPADLVVIGSHCRGLDALLSELRRRGRTIKSMHVGSLAGLNAVRRGECDLAGVHMLDPATGKYNRPYLTDGLELIPGYRRMQCFVHRAGDPRFGGKPLDDAVAAALADPDCVMVNRNSGSGTRMLIDRLLASHERSQPAGFGVQPASHNAVAAAVQQGRADWGVAIEPVARAYGLAAIPIQAEEYDFIVATARRDRPPVQEFVELLESVNTRERLTDLGFDC